MRRRRRARPSEAGPWPRNPARKIHSPAPLDRRPAAFANIGGDPEQEHFVDGVTESLTTDLLQGYGRGPR